MKTIRQFLILLCLVGSVPWCSDEAFAGVQVGDQEDLYQEDLDGDGLPDLTTIPTSFATTLDEIHVYDGARNMGWGDDWSAVADFQDDTWVFDVAADGSAQMVIRFSRDGDRTAAAIFDDQDGDGAVSYEVRDRQVYVTESAHPPLRIVATGGWLLPDGQLNWNVRFLTDGPSIAHVHTYNLSALWERFFDLDGEPDAELQFRDQDLDGVPEYGMWRMLVPVVEAYVSKRTFAWANVGRHRPSQPAGYVFWPYLDPEPAALNYFDAPVAIIVDWAQASVEQISFSGYPIEQGFHVNTNHRFEEGVVNYANFENAQAYYDLAEDRDNSPELHIRNLYFAARDPHNWELDSPITNIRWSWAQTSDRLQFWDYKLGLAGRHTINSEASLGEYRYLTIPYEDLPNWIMSRSWDFATFVCRENVAFQSSEGIYTWGGVVMPLGDDVTALSRYLAGQIDVDIRQAFQSVPVGWRGELAPELGARPYLYFSPIDRRLHLRRAEYGLWQIDDSAVLHYANLNGDPYLDQWQHLVDGQVQSQLSHLAGFLIHNEGDRVQLMRVAVEPSLFETLPPRNHEEWLALGQQLEAHALDFAPGDLEAMFAQFSGAAWRVSGARLRDLRPEGEGFRFVLELDPGFHVAGANGPDLAELAAGQYVVTYDGAFAVQALTPAHVQILPGTFRHVETDPMVAQPLQIDFALVNTGLEDLASLWVQAYVQQADADPLLVSESAVELLAGQPESITFVWVPPAPGEWQVSLAWGPTPSTGGEDQPLTSQAILGVKVQPRPSLDAEQVAQLSNVGQGPTVIAFLVAIALLASVLLLISIRPARGQS